MNLSWMPQALSDLGALHAYIAERDPAAARKMVQRIHTLVGNLLPANPHAGRPGRVEGTRELVIPGTPFLVPYRVMTGEIQILRVYHHARMWPDRL
jgi:toxin ParE1/3/4